MASTLKPWQDEQSSRNFVLPSFIVAVSVGIVDVSSSVDSVDLEQLKRNMKSPMHPKLEINFMFDDGDFDLV